MHIQEGLHFSCRKNSQVLDVHWTKHFLNGKMLLKVALQNVLLFVIASYG